MIARQIGIVLCRVGAAVLTVQAIRYFGHALPGIVFGLDGLTTELIALTLLAAVPGLVAVGLWVFADRISTIVAPTEAPDTPQSLTDVDIARIGTALIGVYLIVSGVIYAVSNEVASFVRPDFGAEYQAMFDEQSARIIGYRVSNLVQLAIGVALLMGRERIAALIARAKRAGVNSG